MSDIDPLVHDLGYFESMYSDSDDPWGFDHRWYESRKYALTIAALPNPGYRRGLEPGCSNGAFTQRLAERCGTLIAFDMLDGPVERARTRLRDVSSVEVRKESFPEFWPEGTGDLVVWSEVAYYLTAQGREVAATGLHRWLETGGHLVATHYTGETNYPMAGTAVAEWLDSHEWLERQLSVIDDEFEIGVWTRR